MNKASHSGVADELKVRILREPCPRCPKPRLPPFQNHIKRGDTLRLPDNTREYVTDIMIDKESAYVYTASDMVLSQNQLSQCVRVCGRCGRAVG